MKKRKSHSVIHNVEMVIGHSNNLSMNTKVYDPNNLNLMNQEVPTTKWAGMNVATERRSGSRFKRTKDVISDWND